jgi:hypothetical protein
MPVNSCVPAAVPLVTHKSKLPLESRPLNRTLPLNAVIFVGLSEAPAITAAVPACVPSVSQRVAPLLKNAILPKTVRSEPLRALAYTFCVPAVVPFVVQRYVLLFTFGSLAKKSTSPLNVVRSEGSAQKMVVPLLLPISSYVPAAVPLVAHRRFAPFVLRPLNTTSSFTRVKSAGSEPPNIPGLGALKLVEPV